MADTSNDKGVVGHEVNKDGDRLTFALKEANNAVAGAPRINSPVVAEAVQQVSKNVQGIVANPANERTSIAEGSALIPEQLVIEVAALDTADTIRADRSALLPGDLSTARRSVEPVTTEGAPTTTVEASKWTTRLGQIGDTITQWWETRPRTPMQWFLQRPEAVLTAGIFTLATFTATTAIVASRYSNSSDAAYSTPVAPSAETATTSTWTSSSSKLEDELPTASATNTVSLVTATPSTSTIEVSPAPSSDPLIPPTPSATIAPSPISTPKVVPSNSQPNESGAPHTPHKVPSLKDGSRKSPRAAR